MIGFYDYTVILTLLSAVSAVIGMTQAIHGRIAVGIICLAVCGLLDTFDGKVARTKKNRTNDEKLYGIQLDSLVDIVCFGLLPVVTLRKLGLDTGWDLAIFCLYVLCGVIRLAYFNVLETNRQMGAPDEEKVYHGLPITMISAILPVFYLLTLALSPAAQLWVLRLLMLVVGCLFVVDFRLKTIKGWQIAVLAVLVGGAAIAALLL